MTQAIKMTLRLTLLCSLWLLVRFTQFVLKVSGFNYAACEVSNAELDLQVRIYRHSKALTSKLAKV